MLVIQRSVDESVNFYDTRKNPPEFIGSVMVTRLRGDGVRLGFDMPEWVSLVRDEIDETEEPTP